MTQADVVTSHQADYYFLNLADPIVSEESLRGLVDVVEIGMPFASISDE